MNKIGNKVVKKQQHYNVQLKNNNNNKNISCGARNWKASYQK